MRLRDAHRGWESPWDGRLLLLLAPLCATLLLVFAMSAVSEASMGVLPRLLTADLSLWIAVVIAMALWVLARAATWVRDGTGAGFPLATYGLLCRGLAAWGLWIFGEVDLESGAEMPGSLMALGE